MSTRLASDVVLSGCCAALALLLCLPTTNWVLDVLGSFRVQAGVAALLLGVARMSIRRWLPAALWAAGGVLCLANVLLAPRATLDPTAARDLRIMVQNVHTSNRAFSMVTTTVREVAPDVLAVLETDELWTGALRQQLRGTLPHAEVKPRSDNFGIALFSAQPMDVTLLETPPLGLPSMEAVLPAGGGLVRIIATHPIPPLSARHVQIRNAHIANILAHAAEGSIPTVLVGDLNLAPTSPAWRRLTAGSPLRRAQRGPLPAGTWPAILGVAGISIDHAMIGEGLVVSGMGVLPSVGSDHRGVYVDVARESSGRR